MHFVDCERDCVRLKCLVSINKAYAIIEFADTFLTQNESAKLLEIVDGFLIYYHWMVQDALNTGKILFNFTPKFHMLWHLAHMSQWINPRLTWCYSFEHFVGSVVRSARASMAATAMHRIGAKVLDNMCLLLHVQIAHNGFE